MNHLSHSLIHHFETSQNQKFAYDNGNVAIKGFQDTYFIENIVEKGEIAHFEQFRLFPQCFPKAFFSSMYKNEYIWRKRLSLPKRF